MRLLRRDAVFWFDTIEQLGALAQLVERLLCKQEVRSSILLGSTHSTIPVRDSGPVRMMRMTHPVESLDDLVATIHRLQNDHHPLLVAVDGAGGAGKSTLAAELVTRWGAEAVVVPMDDFIVRDHMLDDSWERGWDRERLARDVLTPALAGEPLAYQAFDWLLNALGPRRVIAPARILIVEGITSMHPTLDEFWHLRVWVDVDPEIARDRGRARDAGTENAQHWELWSRNDARYRAEHRPHERAEVIVMS